VSNFTNKSRLASGISAIAIAAALGVATPAIAQEQTGSLQGHVAGATAGTQVVVVDTHTGRRTVGTVDAEGNYAIFGLRPSDYTITIQGKPVQTATLQVGQAVTVDFAEAAGPGGAIVVTGRRSAQPTHAQTIATNITPAQIENLPQNQRNFLSFAQLAPGLQVTPGQNVQVQAGALASNNVNVLLDGMSFKNPINHGGVFGQNFGLGNPFPQIAIQEYQVQTQNFGAETGQAGSAVITAITKTGGDQFHGSAFLEWQPKAFIHKPFFSHGPKSDYDRKQFGGEFGGPIVPGKVTFYVAAEGISQKLPSSVGNVDPTLFPPDLVSQVNISHNGDFHQGLYFGKLTAYLDDANTLNGIVYVRRESNLTDIAGNATESHGRIIQTRQTRGQIQWNHSLGNFYNQFNAAFDQGKQATPTVTSGPEFILSHDVGATDFSEGILTGAHFFEQGDVQKFTTFKDDATLRMGEHTVKWGGQLVFMDLSRTVANAFEGRFYYSNPGPNGTFNPDTDVPYGARINLQPSPTLHATNVQIGIYGQDEWKPDIHWTVNAGLRWDFETNAHNNDYVTPEPIANALRNYQGWAARGINPEDYISNGHNRKPDYAQFQPRLGVSYDVHGDRDLVFFGGAGRYYDRPLFIEGVIETLNNSNVIRTVFFCPNGGASQGTGSGIDPANCAGFNPALLNNPDQLRQIAASQGGVGGDVWVLPNKIHTPFSDQFDIGVRKRFGDIQTELTFSHVRSHHIFMFARANFFSNGWYTRFLQTDGAGNVIGCTNGGDTWIQDFISPVNYPACPAMNGQLTGFSGRVDRGMDNGKAKYNAIYLKIEKPFTDHSTWGFTEALTIQRAKSNVAQELNNDEMFNAPELDAYGWDHVFSVPKWSSVTSFNWRAPYGFTLSGILSLNSGPAFGHIIFGGAPDGACCFANMGGVFFPDKTIGYKRLDLRVAKSFKMPWGHELTFDFQAFNVFNWLNRTYSTWGAGAGNPPPLTEHGAVGNDQREFQVGASYKF
jgi:outer membrane receptor protein involved in Fe transport